jgi:hypothetical protein
MQKNIFMNDIIASKKIRQSFVLLLILIVGVFIFKEMLPYLSGVLVAIAIFILLGTLDVKSKL